MRRGALLRTRSVLWPSVLDSQAEGIAGHGDRLIGHQHRVRHCHGDVPSQQVCLSKSVLFLCTGNSARSILAESLLNHRGKGKFHHYSAGGYPKGEVHPISVTLRHRPIDRRPGRLCHVNDLVLRLPSG